MHTDLSHVLLRFFLLLSIFALPPDDSLAGTTVVFSELLEHTKNHHPEDELFAQRVHLIEATQSESISLPNPMISYEQMTALDSAEPMKGNRWEFKQKIPFPWKIYLNYEIYNAELSSVDATKKQSQRVRVTQLRTNFFRWMSLHKKWQIKKEQEALYSQLIAVQRTRYISQKISQVELLINA